MNDVAIERVTCQSTTGLQVILAPAPTDPTGLVILSEPLLRSQGSNKYNNQEGYSACIASISLAPWR